jgi:hypothetical protein
MEETPSDVEEPSRRGERLYGPEDVKTALRIILARVSAGQKPNVATVAQDAGLPSMESHVSRHAPAGAARTSAQCTSWHPHLPAARAAAE